MLKRVLAVLGAAFGLLAMFYLVFPWSLTLKNFGLSVEDQLVAQRILTPLLFVALGVVIVLIKPVFRAGLVKENGITCDMGKLGNMRKGVKGAICSNPMKMGLWGLPPQDSNLLGKQKGKPKWHLKDQQTRASSGLAMTLPDFVNSLGRTRPRV